MMKLAYIVATALLFTGCSKSEKVSETTSVSSSAVEAKVASAVTSSVTTAVLRLEKMDCGGCAKKVKKALFEFPGIKTVQANPTTRLVYIEIADQKEFDLDKVIAQIKTQAGYDSVKQ